MPEGHTIHRAARLQRRRFAGHRLRVDSPQGRFADGARQLDARELRTIDAYGKHLFYRWEGGETLHVHLGLFGRFRVWGREAPAPTDGTRMRWRGESGTLHLSGPTACELLDPVGEERLRDRLGPDPLSPRAGDEERFVRTLARRRAAIAQALLDQALIAGIGNVYRAELLFLSGIAPLRPANGLSPDEANELWTRSVDLLAIGERIGRIVTVDPEESGHARPRDVPGRDRLYVYRRAGRPCRRCGTEISRADLSGRAIYWCPGCQRS